MGLSHGPPFQERGQAHHKGFPQMLFMLPGTTKEKELPQRASRDPYVVIGVRELGIGPAQRC